MWRWRTLCWSMVLILALALTSCAGVARVDVPQRAYVAYNDGSLLARYAPIFVLQTYADSYNRIGSPAVRLDDGKQDVYVDPDHPVIYAEQRDFRTAPKAAGHSLSICRSMISPVLPAISPAFRL